MLKLIILFLKKIRKKKNTLHKLNYKFIYFTRLKGTISKLSWMKNKERIILEPKLKFTRFMYDLKLFRYLNFERDEK